MNKNVYLLLFCNKMAISPHKVRRILPRQMDSDRPTDLNIYIPDQQKKKILCVVSSCTSCLWKYIPCLLTTVFDQGNQRSLLVNLDTWRLQRLQDEIKTAICPKIRPNAWPNTIFLHLDVNLHLLGNLIFFKTNISVHFHILM